MGSRASYTPGTFSWVDLATTDAAGAKSFYGELFGWEGEDMPADGRTYTMLRLGDDEVAALYELEPGQRERGEPPHWNSYISVEDADATASSTRELGGTVMMDAFDVMDLGRMCVIQDPSGAIVTAWQPGSHIGASRVNEPGCLCWNELATRYVEAAVEFYRSLFGWGFEPIDTGEGGPEISTITNEAGWRNGSTRKLAEADAGIPSHWLPYFAVESCEQTVGRARQLGAKVLLEPMAIPSGRIAALRDPQGAVFALADGEMDD